jgi:hypothetical protein
VCTLIYVFNRALMRSGFGIMFIKEREALWKVVVDSKYDSAWGGWYSNEVHESYGMGL